VTGSQILKPRPAVLAAPKLEMGGIADPLLRGNSLGFSQLEQLLGHQPRRPPLVGRDASIHVAVLWLEAYLALTSLGAWLSHEEISRTLLLRAR
jgi:hypothetical protein